MPKWNRFTERHLSRLTSGLKRKRVEQFVRLLNLGPNDIVLDLGSEDGSYLASYYPHPHNIVLGDLAEDPLKRGVEKYGLKDYLVLPPNGPIPVGDRAFAPVWCNSVIEHVTVGRDELSTVTSHQFRDRADAHQRLFAREIERIACKYFVQTPYLYFAVEAHSWLPGVQFVGQRTKRLVSLSLKKYWVKQWTPDFHLYDWRRFRSHFGQADLFLAERFLGITKSIIAIRTS